MYVHRYVCTYVHMYVRKYVPNCSVEIAKQKKEVLERLQKTLEELSQRVPEVGHLAWPDGSTYKYTCRSHSHGHICGNGTELVLCTLCIWVTGYT